MGYIRISNIIVLYLLISFSSCTGQNQTEQSSRTIQTTSLSGDTVKEIPGEVRSIFQDSKSNFWFGTNGNGIFKYDGKVVQQYTDKHGLCNNFVWEIKESKNGSFLIRTRDDVCIFNGSVFDDVKENSLALTDNFSVNEIISDYNINSDFAQKLELPKTSPLKSVNIKFDYEVYCSLKDSKGNWWFGTCTAGVCKYDGKNFTWLNYPELGAPVRAIFEDRNGNIWFGNNGYGLFTYDGKTLINVTRKLKLENDEFLKSFESKEGTLARVWSITDDADGNLWIGTIDAGVWKYDGKQIKNYTTEDGLGTLGIWTIYKDKSSKLWFGTEGAGVYSFDGNNFNPFKVTQ